VKEGVASESTPASSADVHGFKRKGLIVHLKPDWQLDARIKSKSSATQANEFVYAAALSI
jgi:hypothetical protein